MAKTIKPSQNELRQRFSYDPKTGVLTTKDFGSGRSFRRGGRIAGHLRKDGYVHVQIGPKSYYAHCIIWCWVKGDWPTTDIDHRDTVRNNNRWKNLRISTKSQNAFARIVRNPDRGIEILPNGKYRARIGVRRRRIHLGCFETKRAAIEAFQKKASSAFGQFAREST